MALVEFYIKNFKRNNNIVTTETLMQTIPFANLSNGSAIKDPKVKGEMGKAGSFDFGMEPSNPYYNSMMQMKTIMRVVYSGKTIFRGRVLTIDKGMWASRAVHCEGSFAFLLDSHQEGTKEDTRPTINVKTYLNQIITAHNADVEADKQFTLGEVPGHYTSATSSEQRVKIPSDRAKQKFGSTSWDASMNRLEDLLDDFGGYFRVRYNDQNGVSYLDWFDKYYDNTLNSQSIEVAKNLIDLSGTTEVDNLFTILVPIGKNESDNVYISDYWPTASPGHAKVKYIQVPELATKGLYTDAELNTDYHKKSDYLEAIDRYGKIWKPVDFENADTPEKLFMYAKDWIKNNYMPEITQWDVTALDLKTHDSTKQPLMVGDRVPLRHPEVTNPFGSFTIISAEYDLYHMDKTKYTIGIPNQILNAAYGVKQKQDKSGKSGGKGKSGGGGGRPKSSNPPSGDDGDAEIARIKSEMQQQYSLKTDWGKDITQDNPLAFLAHNEKGERLTPSAFTKNLRKYNKDIIQAGNVYRDPMRVIRDAQERGLDPNDPSTKGKLMGAYMAEHNPTLAQQQSQWKSNTENFFVNTLGLTQQEANVLLNESSGTSWLAGLVDDDGNWTDAAIRSGITLRPNRDAIKQQAINTRKLLSKSDGGWEGTRIVNGIREYIVGDKLDLGNFLFADGGNLKFDLGQMFNLDGVRNIFKLISNALNLDGENGKAGIGKYSGGDWKIKFNEPFTYTDIDGQEHTIPADGLVSAADFSIPTVPSFKSKLIVVDNLLADYAKINTLEALKASIDQITGKEIVSKTVVRAEGGYFTKAYVSNLYATGGVYYTTTSASGGSSNVGLHKCYNYAQFINGTGTNAGKIGLQLFPADGSTANTIYFDIAATEKYIADVAAARKDGRGDVYVNDISIGAGETKTYKLKYTDPSTGHEKNTGKTFTVTASGGGSSSYSLDAYLVNSGSSPYSGGINISVNPYRPYNKIDVYVNGTYVDHIDVSIS